MIIRHASKEDLYDILEIMNDAILNSTAIYDYNTRSQEFINTWFNKKTEECLPILICEHDEKVAGYGSYSIFRPWEAYKHSAEHSVYIKKEYQGKGYGGAILQGLIQEAKKQNFHTLIAGIDADNKISYEFHKKNGFEEVARFREVGFKFDRWLDLIFMQLLL